MGSGEPQAFLATFSARMGVDRAVYFALLSRGWRALGGVVSVVLIAWSFSPEVQGYFYTFQSLVALQVFVELGLSVVVVNVVSHEWAKLSLDASGRILGDDSALSRLVSVGRRLAAWYAVAALLFVFAAGIGGGWFLAQKGGDQRWLAPWLATVLVQGLVLWMTPFVAVVEGCNQIVSVQRFQLWLSVTSNVALWFALVSGWELWSVPVLIGVQAAATVYFLGVRYRQFFRPFWRPCTGPQIDWEGEVWPMQWRLALQGVVNYFVYSLYVPVIFHYHGAAEAGRLGMTWQVFLAVQGIALAWVQTRVPRFGSLVATRAFDELNKLWWGMTVRALVAFAAGYSLLFASQLLLIQQGYPVADRLLTPAAAALLLPAGLLAVWVQCAAFYWRAHKTEPLGFAGVIPGLINGATVWYLGQRFGSTGAVAAYFATLTVISLPLSVYLKGRVERAYSRR